MASDDSSSAADLTDLIAKDHTIQMVVQEIRNPLTVIGGFARRLAKSVEFESTGSQYVNIILSEVERMEDFLSKMIKKSKSESSISPML
jgi:signal transduction histidine kinase